MRICIVLSLLFLTSALVQKQNFSLTSATLTISQISIINDSSILFSSSNTVDAFQPLILFNYHTKNKIPIPKVSNQQIMSYNYDSIKNNILFGDGNSTVTVYSIDQASQEHIVGADNMNVKILDFQRLANGQLMSVGSNGKICKNNEGEILCKLAHAFNSTIIEYLQIGGKSVFVTTGGDLTLRLWDQNLSQVKAPIYIGRMVAKIQHTSQHMFVTDIIGNCLVFQYQTTIDSLHQLYFLPSSSSTACLNPRPQQNLFDVVNHIGMIRTFEISSGKQVNRDSLGMSAESCMWRGKVLASGHRNGIGRIWERE